MSAVQQSTSLRSALFRSWIILAMASLVTSGAVLTRFIWIDYTNRVSRLQDSLLVKAPQVARRLSGELLTGETAAILPTIQLLKDERDIPFIELLPEGLSCSHGGHAPPANLCERVNLTQVWVEERVPSLVVPRYVILGTSHPRVFESLKVSQLWLGFLPVILMSLLGILWQRHLLHQKILEPLEDLIGKGGTASSPNNWPDEIRTLSSRLTHLLAERDEAISAAHQAKAQSVLGDFVHGLLHDIKTPLCTAGLIVDASQSMHPGDRDKLKTLLQRIGQIVADHRRRLEAQVVPVVPPPHSQAPEPVDLNVSSLGGVLKTLTDEFEESARKQGVMISLFQPEVARRVFVPLSFAELSRAISNLLDNAIEASSHRGRRVSVFVETRDQTAEVVIADTGLGFSAEVLARIQSGVPKSTKSNGQGLGILSAKALVESIGGKLQIITHPAGARILLKIPTRQPPAWFFDIASAGAARIIALDDDLEIQGRLTQSFPGLTIKVFEREKEFLSAHQLDPEALMLVDLHFGGERDGLDLILQEKLQSQAILLSGRVSFDDRVRQTATQQKIRIYPKECLA